MKYSIGDVVEYKALSGEVRILKVISKEDMTLRGDDGTPTHHQGFRGRREEMKGYTDSYGSCTHMVEYWGLDSQILKVITS